MRGTIFLVAVLLTFPIVIAQETPDIYIDEVVISPDEIFTGDQVSVEITVGNIGLETESIDVALFVDNRTEAVDEVEIESLGINDKEDITLFWFAEEGEHTLFIFADYTSKIEEDNEDNNLISVEVTVQKPEYPLFPSAPEGAAWWNSDWHYRVPITASMVGLREDFAYENKMVTFTMNFTALMENITNLQAGSFSKGTFYPDSIRVVEYELFNVTWIPKTSVGREIIFADDYNPYDNANVTVKWVMEGSLSPHERRYYYVYWDTVENGEKRGEFARIFSGIKNAEFEDPSSTQWKNLTEGAVQWDQGYGIDPVEGDMCYRMQADGILGLGGYLWSPGHTTVRQEAKIPDEGKSVYFLNADIFVDSDIEDIEWSIIVKGQTIESGVSTGEWLSIRKNITSLINSNSRVLISFKLEITSSSVSNEQKNITAYIDSFWIETPSVDVEVFTDYAIGWWASTVSLKTKYIKGVEGENKLDDVHVKSSASPKEVVAKLYSPTSKLVKVSMPLPDPSFEEESFTYVFSNDEKTTSSRIQQTIRNSGDAAVELQLQNYQGTWEFQDKEVPIDAMAGLRQNITYGISLANLPDLSFWYKIVRASTQATLNYTLLTVGSSKKFGYDIDLTDDLIGDGDWHYFSFSEDNTAKNILNAWKQNSGKVIGLEIRLIALAEGAESTIYIDDLGYSFMPSNATDRTNWVLDSFYTFKTNDQTGKWRLDIILTDGSDYRIEQSVNINVDEAADLNILDVTIPEKLSEGETGWFTVKIKNEGKKQVDENTPINVTLSIYQQTGEYIKFRKSVAGLKIGETKSVQFQWLASYGLETENGKWNIVARVNEKGEIMESDTSDNWYPSTIIVEPRPDLKIDLKDVLFSPSNPQRDETANISVWVHNTGFANTTAKLRIFKQDINDGKFILITETSLEEFIEKRSKTRFTYSWTPDTNGTYHIKVEVRCNDEINVKNNIVVKDIKINGFPDNIPPIIENIRVNPSVQSLGKMVNISASIYDVNTTIDRVTVRIANTSGVYHSFDMRRLGITDIYYYNDTYSEIGYYSLIIEAYDTALAEPNQNKAESDEVPFRIIYEDIETLAPEIKAISINPPEGIQALSGTVNITAFIRDDSGIKEAVLIISNGNNEEKYTMKGGESNIYYYEKTCDSIGSFSFYIKATDNSSNANINISTIGYYEVPKDYDFDNIPDYIEIDIGSNPKDASDVINVSVESETGYLIWTDDQQYIYWDRDENESRDVTTMDVDGDGSNDFVFDVNGDGNNDYYYSPQLNHMKKYISDGDTDDEKTDTDTIWLLPPIALFILVCVLFIVVRKKR